MRCGAVALFGVTLGACAIHASSPISAKTHYELREIGVQVRQRDETGSSQLYDRPLQYEAEFVCRSRWGDSSRRHVRDGYAATGNFTISYPSDCKDSANLTLDIFPNYYQCQGSSVAFTGLTGRAEDQPLRLEVLCDSATYRAKLQALIHLGCHERDSAVERTAEDEFHVHGCGRAIDLRCPADSADLAFGCEYGRVHDE